MRNVGRLCAEVHNYLQTFVRPGISTLAINNLVEEYIKSHGGIPACKGYRGYEYSVCTSVNDEVVHCVPSNYKLKNGDIVTVDFAVSLDGFNGDTAKTYVIGAIDLKLQTFVNCGYEVLLEGVRKAIPGNYVSDISNAMNAFIVKHGYGAVEKYVGHGIGRNLHENPSIPTISMKTKGALLVPGMTICIEPILTMYPSGQICEKSQWDIRTIDKSPAVHFEHMVAILENGFEILTLRDDEKDL